VGSSLPAQEPIGSYYADFVCRDRRLIIEVDEGQHAERVADRLRDSNLTALGYRVVRIWNNEVIENIDGVLQHLLSELRK
jgi:very-short-patch-repair endonuclease